LSDKLQKRASTSLKEKTHYFLAFGLVATMLVVANFPMFVVFFFGIFAYFLWKTFSQPSRSETKEIFEFYLVANEILRDDERKWFGFEVQEVLGRGERILQVMNGAPPLVYFTLGALYNKIGDHKSAVNHLSYVVENESADEGTYVYPSPDLRSYVKILRKIEREPAEAPQTSAAVRALERARRNRGKAMLDASRIELDSINLKKREALHEGVETKNEYRESITDEPSNAIENADGSHQQNGKSLFSADNSRHPRRSSTTRRPRATGQKSSDDPFADRKPISEVLHDIYDKNIQ
jgi:hypothetical protein